ncbi:hypothetical protein ABTX60_29180 [Streptomyces sp. NPDC126510]|uniref:hypothetical protein n=1 Tax=Streptomyces sp. NPDC126510 TaxID=3155317 RepID=UPI00332DD5F6
MMVLKLWGLSGEGVRKSEINPPGLPKNGGQCRTRKVRPVACRSFTGNRRLPRHQPAAPSSLSAAPR